MEENRKEMIDIVKKSGNVMVYVGTANLMRPIINKAREDQNGAMQACTILGGAVISFGIAKKASEWMNMAIDKFIDFIDDVKPKRKPEKEEENADG